MASFTHEQHNFAHLVMYIRQKGPKVLRKVVLDKIFMYQLLRSETSLREKLDPCKLSMIFPNDECISSLDMLEDAAVPDISALVFLIQKPNTLSDTQELRSHIYGELEGPIFSEFMKKREERFRKRNKQIKTLGRKQLDEMFSAGGNININNLDITALSFILFEGFNGDLRPLNFDQFPQNSDESPGSDILRIRLCRNELAHNTKAEITDGDFYRLLDCVTSAFERLTGDPTYRAEGGQLKCARQYLNSDQLRSTLEKRREEDQQENMKEFGNIKQAISTSSLNTENAIKESTRDIISAVKKYSNCKPRKSKWNQVFVKDLNKFKAVCEKENLRYCLPDDSSTDSSIASSSSLNSDFGHIGREREHWMPQPELKDEYRSRQQRRGYVFSERDEAELGRLSYQDACFEILEHARRNSIYNAESTVPTIFVSRNTLSKAMLAARDGECIYQGTNSESTGYYTESSAYGYTATDANYGYLNDDESSVYQGHAGSKASQNIQTAHYGVQVPEKHDLYGFSPSSSNCSSDMINAPSEMDDAQPYMNIGDVSKKERSPRLKTIRHQIRKLNFCRKSSTFMTRQ